MNSEDSSEPQDVASQDKLDHTSHKSIPSEGHSSELQSGRAAESESSKGQKPSPAVEKLKASIAAKEPAEKARAYLEFMKAQLDPQQANFRDFWEARRECALCFRNIADIQDKASLVDQLQNMCVEAKGLKVLLEEQSQFAIEQIELAINGLEKELEAISIGDSAYWQPSAFPKKAHFDDLFYGHRQGLLNWLNGFSSRISALRKELIKTDMRVRSKNKLFNHLSEVGDKVFPQRKELIREVSEHFLRDVEDLTHDILTATNLHVLSSKDEVKIWQSLAKELTLNTHAFKKTRELLSGCWEQLKKLDKEFHQQRNAQRSERKEKFTMFCQQIEEIKKQNEANPLSEKLLLARLDDISKKIRKETLAREDQEALKALIDEMKKPILEKEQHQRALDQSKRQEMQRQRDQILASYDEKFKQILESAEVNQVASLQQELSVLHERVGLSAEERCRFESMIQNLKDQAFDLRLEQLLSKAQAVKMQEAEALLEDLFEYRAQLRRQLDSHKRQAGASGMDFQKAMELGVRVSKERERIESLENAINAVQAKIGQ